jgi:hypothetical protein
LLYPFFDLIILGAGSRKLDFTEKVALTDGFYTAQFAGKLRAVRSIVGASVYEPVL